MNKLLITKMQKGSHTYIASALCSEKRLLEITLEPEGRQSILGNIYVGRVKNIVKNLNAAFIEIAPGVPCYYPLDEMKQPLFVKKINSPRLVQGDELRQQKLVRGRRAGGAGSAGEQQIKTPKGDNQPEFKREIPGADQ